MKRWLLAICIMLFSLLFLLCAAVMHMSAIGSLQDDFALGVALSIFVYGPLSILLLAACAAMVRSAYAIEDYKRSRIFFIGLASMQLISMVVYFTLIWRAE
tara:strand:- start:35832 stop:36134 length:303 start_codon:yes stop_codon:yes gene_type:complete